MRHCLRHRLINNSSSELTFFTIKKYWKEVLFHFQNHLWLPIVRSISSRLFLNALFKIILEGKLQIPNNFIKKYGGVMPNPVFLKPPDGTQWEIYWTKYDDGGVWFEKGWKEVATYYSLDHGHLVVFKYEMGTCDFVVNIFDMSATEIEYPLHGNLEQNSDYFDSCKILYEIPPPQKATRKLPLSSSFCPYKKTRTGEAERTSGLQNMHQGKGKKFKKWISAEVNFTKQEKEGDIDGSSFLTKNESSSKKCPIIKGKEKPLTCSEKAKALQRVSTFMSKNPHFKIAMQPAYVLSSCLSVPARFFQQNLKNKKKEGAVLLRVSDGRTWSAKYKIWVKGSNLKVKISRGWNTFARDNNLKVGDVCVFELINSIGISFLVHIFGDSENPSC